MLNSYRKTINRAYARRILVEEDIRRLTTGLREHEDKQIDIEEANQVVLTAAKITQEQLQHRIGNTVTVALAAVFEDPYEFTVKFVERRGATECDLFFVRRDEEMKPLDDSGFGAADVASFALKFSCWQDSGNAPVLLFDEPARNVSAGYRVAVGAMMKMLSEKLSVQIICVTHMEELKEAADKIFLVENVNDRATVEEGRLCNES